MAEFRGLCKNVALLDLLTSFSAVQRKKKPFVEGCSLEKQFFFQIISVGILLHVKNLKQQLEKKVK